MPIEIPPALITAVVEQRAVLFLGAGASLGASHPKENNIPNGSQLRDLLCDRFLGGKLKDRPLAEVAEFSVNDTSTDEVQLYVSDLLKDFRAAIFHKLIPTFRWHAIVTTNIDLVVEDAYNQEKERLQQLVPFYKNGQFVETESKKFPFPLHYLKLHGCIDHPLDHEAPFILAMEQYAQWYQGRSRLFERVKDWGRELPFIFCGYSVGDPHIQSILFELFGEKLHRPNYFCIAPNLEDVEIRYWTRQRVTPIKADFKSFLEDLDQKIPKVQRLLPRTLGSGESSLRKHYRAAHQGESALLLSFLADDGGSRSTGHASYLATSRRLLPRLRHGVGLHSSTARR